MLDRQTKTEIVMAVRDAANRIAVTYDERWLTADQLVEQFGFFTLSWLRRYGHLLPRTRVEVKSDDGKCHVTSWCYPRNKIQTMIQDGTIKNLKNK